MNLKRMFSTAGYKGNRQYLNTQKKYEIFRTVLYFAISLSLFIGGFIATGDKLNLLTIVAVLGCLPASKSLVETIMYMRFHSCPDTIADLIEQHTEGLTTSYDLIFTTYDKNYDILHLAIRGTTIACLTNNDKLDENTCVKHLTNSLNLDGIKNITLKIFKDEKKYCERLEQLLSLAGEKEIEANINNTLLSIAL